VDISMLLMALLIGALEGLTEFLPISSTGHIILVTELLGFEGPPGKVFEICIQLGAILAVCWLYRQRIFDTLGGLFRRPRDTRFAINLFVAFLPSAVIGVLANDFIKGNLFNPWIVSVMLIIGGFIILAIERWAGEGAVKNVDDFTFTLALKIGFCQVVSMIPGVSRSGATIMGSRLLGVQRAAATEFSFYLAIPTMLGASVYSAYKAGGEVSGTGWMLVGLGFVVAFVTALFVVRGLIAFISRHGFQPFAWYRIALGTFMLVVLSVLN
jgi:undecaprenyl-diphosphatase